jgi:hypothetical protein
MQIGQVGSGSSQSAMHTHFFNTHLPSINDIIVTQIHYQLPKLSLFCSLESFCEQVCEHLIGWTFFNPQILLLDMICHKKVTDVNVTCLLDAGHVS